MTIFGFKDLKDVNIEIIKDNDMKKRMKNYNIMSKYSNIMKAFKKTKRNHNKRII